jgi:hypothetical protein
MTDYLQNGYQYMAAAIGPTNAQGIFFGVAGTLKIVTTPFTSAAVEALSVAVTTGVVTIAAGLTVTAGGLTVTAGGLTVTAGNALVTAGTLIVGASGTPYTSTSTGTVNVIETNSAFTGVSGVFRGGLFVVDFQGTNVGATTNVYGVRGYAKVSGTFAGAGCWAAGVQGKVELSGTMTDGRVTAILAQMNSSAGTFTAGLVNVLTVDSQLTSSQAADANTAGQYNMVNIGNGALCNSWFYISGYAKYLFDIAHTGGDFWIGASAITGASRVFQIQVDGVKYYILAGTGYTV